MLRYLNLFSSTAAQGLRQATMKQWKKVTQSNRSRLFSNDGHIGIRRKKVKVMRPSCRELHCTSLKRTSYKLDQISLNQVEVQKCYLTKSVFSGRSEYPEWTCFCSSKCVSSLYGDMAMTFHNHNASRIYQDQIVKWKHFHSWLVRMHYSSHWTGPPLPSSVQFWHIWHIIIAKVIRKNKFIHYWP